MIDACPPETWAIIARAAGGPATARCRAVCRGFRDVIDSYADFDWRIVRFCRLAEKCIDRVQMMKETPTGDVMEHMRKLASVVVFRDFTLASIQFSRMNLYLPPHLIFAIIDPPLFPTARDPERSVRRGLNSDGILYECFRSMGLGEQHERAFFGDMTPQRERKSILSQYFSQNVPIDHAGVLSQMSPMQLACMMGNHVQFQEELDHQCITRGEKNALLDLNLSILILVEAEDRSSKSNCFTLSSFISIGGNVQCAKIFYEFVLKHRAPPFGPRDVFLQLFAPSDFDSDASCTQPLHIAVAMNRTELVKWILAMEPGLIHLKDHAGVLSTLDYVGTHANECTAGVVFDAMALALPPLGAPRNDPLHASFSTLLEKVVDSDNCRVMTCMAKRLDITCAELLLTHPTYMFKAVQSNGRQCLSVALKSATPEQIAQISDLCADDSSMHSMELRSCGVLRASAASSDVAKLKLLLDAGVRFRKRSEANSCRNESPLFLLIHYFHYVSKREMLVHYLSSGAVTEEEVNIAKDYGGAIFFLLDVARMFRGDDARQAADVMMRLLDIVCPTGNEALPSKRNLSLISCTLEMGEFVFTRLLLERGICLEKDSLFRVARGVGRDRESALRFRTLLDHGCPPDVTNEKDGSTPLHVLAKFGTVGVKQCMEMLIRAGADVDAGDVDGTTPLMYGIRFGRLSSVTSLLDLGADLCAKDARGENFLHMICRAFTPERLDTTPLINQKMFNIIDKIKQHGEGKYFSQMKAMFLEANNEGHTPIDYIFMRGNDFMYRKHRTTFVWIMHSIGMDMNVLLGPDQETMLHKAAKIDDAPAIRALLEAGADKKIKNLLGVLPRKLTRNPEIFLLL